MKDNHFKLSNSFTSLFSQKGTLNSKETPASHSLDKGLFKLNPKLANHLDDVPVEMLKKKSKNKLQSLKDKDKDKKWSIFQSKMEVKQISKDKKIVPKKYHIDINNGQGTKTKNQLQNKQIQLAYDIVRPSKLNQINLSSTEHTQITVPSLFQTPSLPCFASEFKHNIHHINGIQNQFKSLQQKQGVWKIGKIKVKNGKTTLNIGGIQFDATQAHVSGKTCVVKQDNLYQLPNWNKIWVVQPSEQLFKQQK